MSPKLKTDISNRAKALQQIALIIARGEKLEIIKSWWEKHITDITISGVRVDVDDLVQDVLNQSYLESSRYLQIYAEEVNYYNRIRKEIRDRIKKLHEKLNSVEDDAQLADIDLQNALQKQQQTIQMLSNISKMLSDTAMAVIRKIGS
jgi:DNA-directed RNA polymerase specialized sigma24 family protein